MDKIEKQPEITEVDGSMLNDAIYPKIPFGNLNDNPNARIATWPEPLRAGLCTLTNIDDNSGIWKGPSLYIDRNGNGYFEGTIVSGGTGDTWRQKFYVVGLAEIWELKWDLRIGEWQARYPFHYTFKIDRLRERWNEFDGVTAKCDC